MLDLNWGHVGGFVVASEWKCVCFNGFVFDMVVLVALLRIHVLLPNPILLVYQVLKGFFFFV